MDLFLATILFLGLIPLIWYFISIGTIHEHFSFDDFLVQNYHQKPNYKQKVVLVIESYIDTNKVVSLLRNVLQQVIKVNSIILIAPNNHSALKKINLIRNTCVLNKVGGLSCLLKESSNDTILVFIFSEGFEVFEKPHFLKEYLETGRFVNGLVKVNTSDVVVDINKVYDT